jgi:hypothetical protein
VEEYIKTIPSILNLLLSMVLCCNRYKEGWGLITDENGLYLTWKDQPVICTSAWRLDL